MATFEEQIEGITQIDITDSSAPTQTEVSNFLTDAVKDLINKLIRINPQESYKFASQAIDNGTGVTVNGVVLSVVRENGNSDDVRPAAQIPSAIKYLATDKTSLYYRSAFNPCFYTSNQKLFVLPKPTSSVTRGIISHVTYKDVLYSDSSIEDFPDEYEDLIMIYAAAMSCQAAANNIHNNMPVKPTAPQPAIFDVDNVNLPPLPVLTNPLDFNTSFNKVNQAINKEDFDKASKEFDVISKELEIYSKNLELSIGEYNRELEVFKSTIEVETSNKDRDSQIIAGEYTAEVNKYQAEIGSYSAELQVKAAEYKWYMDEYMKLMTKYNESIGLTMTKSAEENEREE